MTAYILDTKKIFEIYTELSLSTDWKKNREHLSEILNKNIPFADIAACWSHPGDYTYFSNSSEDYFKNYFKEIKRADMVQSKEPVEINNNYINDTFAISVTLEGTYLGMILVHLKSEYELKKVKEKQSKNEKVISIDSDIEDITYEDKVAYLKLFFKTILPQISLAKYASEMALEVEKRTSTDKLTGLWNRNYFNERFREECIRLSGTREQGAVAVISLDDLAAMEKVIGKEEHEKLIIQAAGLIRKMVRKTDWIVYWDKHEILVYLTNTQSDSSIEVMNRCTSQLANAHPLLTPLIGLCSTTETTSARALIQLSARRLELARKDGRKMIVCFAAKDGLKFIQMSPKTLEIKA